MRIIFLILCSIVIAGTPASAQFGPIDDILDDIIGGSKHPAPVHSLIDTIPVNVDIKALQDLAGHSLVLNAYKPAGPGMTQPELIGQTRILLTGLPNTLGMVIAVPEPVTRDLDFAVINGAVLDSQGQEIMIATQEQFYRGRKSVELTLISLTSSQPSAGSNTTIGKPEQIEGKVYLPSGAPDLMRGATLTIELLETDQGGLAGGGTETVIGQTFVDIDQEKAPFKFKLDYILSQTTGKTQFIRAYITDWAGRLIYETRQGEPFRGADDNYKVNLDPAPVP